VGTDRTSHVLLLLEFDESVAPGFAFLVLNQCNLLDGTILLKLPLDAPVACVEGHPGHEQGLVGVSSRLGILVGIP
jgi:hypothetical protein